MAPKQSFLYRLGYALERARREPTTESGRLAGFLERRARDDDAPARPDTETVLLTVGTAVLAKALDLWRPRRSAGLLRLARAAAAGAAAALLVDLVRPLLRGDVGGVPLGAGTPDRLLSGASQGVLYGAAIEPRVPGPLALRGALYGTVEYVADPVGGLVRLLGPHAPHRRLPFLADLLEGLEPHDRAYLEHVLFGVALATLYGRTSALDGAADGDSGE